MRYPVAHRAMGPVYLLATAWLLTATQARLSPVEVAKILAGTVTSLSVFCDLLTQVVMP